MKTPPLLKRLRSGILRAVPGHILDGNRTFIEYPALRLLLSAFEAPAYSPAARVDTEAFRRKLMNAVTPLIRAIWPGVNSGRKWCNSRYCPKTAIGDYLWVFQAQMVQEIIWLRPEFVNGFRTAMLLDLAFAPGRDNVPYSKGDDRHGSWIQGFNLGLAARDQSNRKPSVDNWLKWLESDDALPGVK